MSEVGRSLSSKQLILLRDTFFALSHVALKPLVKKQLSAWRPITARLVLLKKLVSEFGLEGGGLAADGIMSFIQVSGCVTRPTW